MNKLKIILPAVVLLIAAVYGGFKAYVYYKVSGQLERMTATAAPFAHIKYQGIASSLDGQVIVEKVRVVPQGVADEANIAAIGLHTDGPASLLSLLSGLEQGEAPEKLAFFVRGMRVPLDGEFATQYSGLLQGFNQASDGQPRDGCAFGGWVSIDELRGLGMDALMLDMDMGYKSERTARDVEAYVKLGVQGIESTEMDIMLSAMPKPGMVMTGEVPQVKEFSIRYELDPDFAANALKGCAELRGQTPEAYIDSLFEDKARFAQTLGIIPGPGISKALKAFLTQPGGIMVSIHPPLDFDFQSLGRYAPKDWAELLGLELEVNGQAVTDLSFSMPEEGAGLVGLLPGMEEAQRATSSDSADDKSKKERKKRYKLKYVVTPAAELPNFVDKSVRIYTVNAQVPREGRLLSVTDYELTVEQSLHGGNVMAHIPLAEITKAEVLKAFEQ